MPTIARQERLNIVWKDYVAIDVLGWNLRHGFGQSFSYATIESQTTTWVRNNLTLSPSTLVRNRDADVNTMVTNSQVYEWGTTGSGTTSTPGRRWMEVFNQMASNQAVYLNFSSVADDIEPPQPQTQVLLPENQKPLPVAQPDPVLGVQSMAQQLATTQTIAQKWMRYSLQPFPLIL